MLSVRWTSFELVHSSLWRSILCAKIVIFGLHVWYKVTYLPFSLHFNTLSWWILFFLYTFNWRSADILHTSCCCWFLETYYTGGKIGSNIWDKSPSFSACGIDTSNEAVTADPRVLCSAFSVCVCMCVIVSFFFYLLIHFYLFSEEKSLNCKRSG